MTTDKKTKTEAKTEDKEPKEEIMKEKEDVTKDEVQEEVKKEVKKEEVQQEAVKEDAVKSETEIPNELEVKFAIEVPAEKLDEDFDKALAQYASEIKMPGFRKGKVPMEVIKARFSDAIKDEVANKAVETALFEKIRKDKIKIMSHPQVENFNQDDAGNITADIVVQVFPTVDLPELETLQVEIPAEELSGQAYDEAGEIDRFLDHNKRRAPVHDRPVQDEDTVRIKYQSKVLATRRMTPRKEGVVNMSEKEAQSVDILDIMSELKGKNLGDQVTFTRTYPEDFKKKPWAGKELEHYVTVEGIFEAVKPELDEEFLKNAGVKDEAEFKSKLKEQFEAMDKQRVEDVKIKHILDMLSETVVFPVPEAMIKEEMPRLAMQNPQRFNLGQVDTTDPKALTELIRTEAEKSVRTRFIVEAVVDKYKLEASREDMEGEYKRMAEQNQFPVEEVRKFYNENRKHSDEVKSRLINEKMITLLKEKIKIIEKK